MGPVQDVQVSPPYGTGPSLKPETVEEIARRQGGIDPAFFGYPQNIQNLARMLANYSIMPSSLALAKPEWMAAVAAAQYLDPSFDAAQYGIRYGVRRGFTSGQDAANLTAIDTTMKHLNSLHDAIAKLNNSPIQPWNWAVNTVEQKLLDDPRVQRFGMTSQAVADELTRVFRGTAGAERQVQEWKDKLSANLGKSNQNEAVDSAIELLAGRIEAMRNKWERGFQSPANFQFFTDNAKKAIARLGFDPEALNQGRVVKLGQTKTAATPQTGSPNSPSEPAVGTVVDGFRYKGGGAGIQSNWEKVAQ